MFQLSQKSKFALFSHKRTRSESEADGFICPLELNGQYTNGKVNFPCLFVFVSMSARVCIYMGLIDLERFTSFAS